MHQCIVQTPVELNVLLLGDRQTQQLHPLTPHPTPQHPLADACSEAHTLPTATGLPTTHQCWGHEATGLGLLQSHAEDVHRALSHCLLQQLLYRQEGAQLCGASAAMDLELDRAPGQ